MSDYLVFACPRCGSVRYAKEEQRTAICFTCRCQISLQLQTTRILLRVKRAEEAIEAVKIYKMRLGKRGQRHF